MLANLHFFYPIGSVISLFEDRQFFLLVLFQYSLLTFYCSFFPYVFSAIDWAIGLMSRVFDNSPGDRGSNTKDSKNGT